MRLASTKFELFPENVPVSFIEPCTCSVVVGDAVPIPTFPVVCTINGVASGLALSSTTSAFPVPVCVILTMSLVLDADATMDVSIKSLLQFALPSDVFETNTLLVPSLPSNN